MTHENDDTIQFSHVHNGVTHTPENYRIEYTTEYDENIDIIKLNPTGNKICGECFENEVYNNIVITYDNVYDYDIEE